MIGEMPTSRTRLAVFKIRGKQSVCCTFRSAEVASFSLHWLGRRSFICPGLDCPADEQSVGSRWSAFAAADFSFGDPERREFGLLEFTESAYERLRFMRQAEQRPDFVGLRCVASRRRDKAPLRFDLPDEGPSYVAATKSLAKMVLIDAVATLYGLPVISPGEELASWEERAMPVARRLIGRAIRAMQD